MNQRRSVFISYFMPRKILVILGHRRVDSLCGALADAYSEAATAAGAEVQRLNIQSLNFDPIGVAGENQAPPPEADILAAQSAIHWAEHLVFFYPIWWGTVPALMKGFLERTFASGFAIEFPDRPPYWRPLLGGRSARLVTTMNAPPWFFRWRLRAPGHNVMKRAVLGVCGIKPVRITAFGPVKGSSLKRRQKWIEHMRELGRGCR